MKKLIINIVLSSILFFVQDISFGQAGENVESKKVSSREKELSQEYKNLKKSLYTPDSKDHSDYKKLKMDSLVQVMADEVPNSYLENIAIYSNSNNPQNLRRNLDKAYQLQPNNSEIHTQYISYAELTNQPGIKKEFISKLAVSNSFDESVMNYNANVLNSIPSQSILITNGEIDTYPAWIKQEMQTVNPNAVIWNIELLQNENYRNQQFDKSGIPLLNGVRNTRVIIDHILKNKNNGEVYLALTLPHDVLRKYSSHLFLTGLAMQYDLSPSANNMVMLQNNWENRFDKETIKDSHSINRNYIAPLVQLYNYYISSGQKKKSDSLKTTIKKLAKSHNFPNPIKE